MGMGAAFWVNYVLFGNVRPDQPRAFRACLIGGYGLAIMAKNYGVNPWLAIAISLILSIALALLIGKPLLRLRGHYLSMGTVALALVALPLLARLTIAVASPTRCGASSRSASCLEPRRDEASRTRAGRAERIRRRWRRDAPAGRAQDAP